MALTEEQLKAAISGRKGRGFEPAPEEGVEDLSFDSLLSGLDKQKTTQTLAEEGVKVPDEGFFSKLPSRIAAFGPRATAERAADVVKQQAGEVKEKFGQVFRGEISPVAGAVGLVGEVFETGGELFGAAIAPAVEPIVEQISKTKLGSQGLEALARGSEAFDEFKKEHPELGTFIEGGINIATAATGVKTVTAAGPTVKAAGKRAVIKAAEVAEEAAAAAKKAIPKVKTVVRPKRLAGLEEKISPKLTIKEKRRALQEGRVIETKESFLFGKKPDKVIASGRIKKAAITLDRLLPKATKASRSTLIKKTNELVRGISEKLRPNLKKVKVAEDQLNDVVNSWTALKQKQLNLPEFEIQPGVFKKEQNLFESRVNSLVDKDNLSDVWDSRIAYDKTIPENVKQATLQSSEALQFRKDMWLDNRRILSDMIEKLSDDLEKSTKAAFDDMSDLYLARQNIISRGEVATKASPGVISRRNVIRGLVGTTATGAGIKFIAS